ncbi:MAG: hypothetical protein DRH15_12695 [Deltaproteobacteria bacterium]|nr:MAG: hypothetical protein DRH15_12695 [Deltaproteobacteria bacterium]
MKKVNYRDIRPFPVDRPDASGVAARLLISRADGAPNFSMRMFELEPGGYTPRHSHPYEHLVFVLEGEGEVLLGGAFRPLAPGDAVFVPPDGEHQFRNTGGGTLRFLCLVPNASAVSDPLK